jgi:hypothetical protein
MKYIIGNQTILIEAAETQEAKGTPNQIVGWRDVAETARNVDAICDYINTIDSSQLKIVDAIARSGFWSAVFRNKWDDCILHLNEEHKECLPALQRNFPNDKITSLNIRNWTPKSRCDLSILDFDYFTLKKLHSDKMEEMITAWDAATSKYVIIGDGACFGFKFGNMKHYGIRDEKEYYYLLRDEMKPYMTKRLTVVSKFNNAAMLLFENTRRVNDIKFLPPTSLYLSKGNKTYGGQPEELKPLF